MSEKISRLGMNHFLWQFRKACIGWGPLHPPARFELDFESAPPKPELGTLLQILRAITIPHEWICMALFALLCIGMTLYVGEVSLSYYLFASLLVFILVYFGSLLWAFRTYRNWLASVVTHVSTTQTLPR